MGLLILGGRSGVAAEAGGGDLEITSVSGTQTHGSTLTINGSGFGSHADFGGSEPFLCRAWNDFSSTLEGGGWVQDGQDAENCILSTSSPLGEACGQFYRKRHVSANQGSMEVQHGSNFTGIYYTYFWYKESDNSPVIGDGACTKLWRRYLGPEQGVGGYNWYLGPEYENATNFVTPPASLNRWTQHPDDPFFPQATWRFMEIIEFLGNTTGDGTEIFGSPDFLAIRLANVELIRRGTGLPDNPVPEQGTDANENQQWVGDPPEGQEGGVTKLGSHLCETTAGYFLDYHDAYLNYGPQCVMIGTESTYSANTGFHMQPPTAWSGSQIQVTVNRGQFASISGRYLFVRNEDGEVSPGFLLS